MTRFPNQILVLQIKLANFLQSLLVKKLYVSIMI